MATRLLLAGVLTTVLVVLLWATSVIVPGPWRRTPAPRDERLPGRVATGTILVGLLTMLLVLVLTSRAIGSGNTSAIFAVGIAVIVLAGSLAMRTWWSMLAIPLAMAAALGLSLLWPEPECTNCRPDEVPDLAWLIVFAVALGGPIALIAALGTFIPLWAGRVLRRLRHGGGRSA